MACGLIIEFGNHRRTPQGDTSGTVSHSMKGLLHTLDEAADFRDPSLRIIFKPSRCVISMLLTLKCYLIR